jgi:hypothetical protein
VTGRWRPLPIGDSFIELFSGQPTSQPDIEIYSDEHIPEGEEPDGGFIDEEPDSGETIANSGGTGSTGSSSGGQTNDNPTGGNQTNENPTGGNQTTGETISSGTTDSGTRSTPTPQSTPTPRSTPTPTQTASFTVTFANYDGSVIVERTVVRGRDATPPSTNPSRVGHTFTGWSPSYRNIQANRTITAQYTQNVYEVRFVDMNGDIIGSVQNVSHGANATAPTPPSVFGYTFARWDHSINDIQANQTITAVYARNIYEVRFVDMHGNTIGSVQNVQHGSNATAPSPPTESGFTFSHWNHSYENIQTDLTIRAVYTENVVMHVVTFLANGVVIATIEVAHGATVTAPVPPHMDGHTFSGSWTGTGGGGSRLTNVTGSWTRIAVYTPDPVDPGDPPG